MIDPLEDAREELQRATRFEGRSSESRHLRDTLRALIQHGEEMERRVQRAEARLDQLEEPDRPPSGLTMGG